MDEITERYARIAGQFDDRVRAVPAEAWDNPSPCAEWRARDIVGHLAEWIPSFFEPQGLTFAPAPSAEEDPVAAWSSLHEGITSALADPALAERPITTPMGTGPLAETIDQIVVGDVFTHTWDLARATGQDETLDADQVARMSAGMMSIPDELLRGDGMFGPRIEVPADADEQTRLLAFLGRRV